MTKVIIWGPHNVENPATGKTELWRALTGIHTEFNPNYEPSTKTNFATHKLVLDFPYNFVDPSFDPTVEIWDLPGGREFNSLFSELARDSHILLYCVDLSQEVDANQLQDAIDQFKKINPEGKVILVGTKFDIRSRNGYDEFGRLGALKLGFDLKVTTSAKIRYSLDTLLDFITNLATFLHKPPQIVPKEEIESQIVPKEEIESQIVPKEEIESGPAKMDETSIQVFPASYKKIWDAGRKGFVVEEGQHFEGALALLKDYCKTESYNESSLYSSVKRFFTSHMLRHHVTTVRDIVTKFDNPDFKDRKTVENLLEALKTALEDKLVESKKTINPIGSLARRINFIQQEAFGKDTNNHIINIGELNIKIEQGPKTPTSSI